MITCNDEPTSAFQDENREEASTTSTGTSEGISDHEAESELKPEEHGSFKIEQKVFSAALLSYLPQETIKEILSLENTIQLLGTWHQVYNDCDRSLIILQNQTYNNEFIVALSGSNPISLFDWVFCDSACDLGNWKASDIIESTDDEPVIAQSILSSLKLFFEKLEKVAQEESKIYVTGHSKGGAWAPVLGLCIHQSLQNVNVEVLAYAGPTLGNKAFRESLENTCNKPESRLKLKSIRNKRDIFPHIFDEQSLKNIPDLYDGDEDAKAVVEVFLKTAKGKGYDQFSEKFSEEFKDKDLSDLSTLKQMSFQHFESYLEYMKVKENFWDQIVDPRQKVLKREKEIPGNIAMAVWTLGIAFYFMFERPNAEVSNSFFHRYINISHPMFFAISAVVLVMKLIPWLFSSFLSLFAKFLYGLAFIVGAATQLNFLWNIESFDNVKSDFLMQWAHAPWFIADMAMFAVTALILIIANMSVLKDKGKLLPVLLSFFLLGPDCALALFMWFVPFRKVKVMQPVFALLFAGLTAILLGVFFILFILPTGTPDTTSIFVHNIHPDGIYENKAIGVRTTYTTVTIGLAMLFYMFPDMNIKIWKPSDKHQEGMKVNQNYASVLATYLLIWFAVGSVFKVILPAPFYIAIRLGLKWEIPFTESLSFMQLGLAALIAFNDPWISSMATIFAVAVYKEALPRQLTLGTAFAYYAVWTSRSVGLNYALIATPLVWFLSPWISQIRIFNFCKTNEDRIRYNSFMLLPFISHMSQSLYPANESFDTKYLLALRHTSQFSASGLLLIAEAVFALLTYLVTPFVALLLMNTTKSIIARRLSRAFLFVSIAGGMYLGITGVMEKVGSSNQISCSVPELPDATLLTSEMNAQVDRLAHNPADRAQHNYSYTCATGTFTIEDRPIPTRFRAGVFNGKRKEFRATARFSSVHDGDDSYKKTLFIKGLGMKLHDVGESLIDFDAVLRKVDTPKDQDFLAINRDRFFISDADMDYYDVLNQIQQKRDLYSIASFVGSGFLVSLSEAGNRLKVLVNILSLATGYGEDFPLNTTYHSATPYLLRRGDNMAYVKFLFEPCDAKDATICYDMYLREQLDNCNEPVEDSTIPWNGDKVRVGRFTSESPKNKSECNQLGFNPWHTVPEFFPLGKLNKERLTTYSAAQYLRKADEIDLFNVSAKTFGDAAVWQFTQYDGFPSLPKYALGFNILYPHFLTSYKDSFNEISKFFFGTAVFSEASEVDQSWPHDKHLPEFSSFLDIFDKENETKGHLQEYPLPNLAKGENWLEDAIFVQTFLSGINPLQLRNASVVSNSTTLVRSLVAEKKLLEINSQTENLFYVDYSDLSRISVTAESIVFPSIVCFVLSKETNSNQMRKLQPLGIFLKEREGEISNLSAWSDYRPDNTSFSWQMAKAHILQADSLIHELVSHLLNTHLMMEPIVLASRMSFAPDHPVFAFLNENFERTLDINTFGRNTLVQRNGSFEHILSSGRVGGMELMEMYAKEYKFDIIQNFTRNIEAKGMSLDAYGKIEGAHSFVDGNELWDINEKYVTRIVNLIYENDNEVQSDIQLQTWYAVLTNAMKADIPGMPDFRRSRATLARVLTMIYYMASQHHATVNNPQYDAYSYIPARPMKLRKPMPPSEKVKKEVCENESDLQWFVESLPNGFEAQTTIFLLRILSTTTENPILREYGATNEKFKRVLHFELQQKYVDIMRDYQAELIALQKRIRKRNENNSFPFSNKALDPAYVSRSISI